MKSILKKDLFLCIAFLFSISSSQAQVSFCSRTAFMGECENLALPENFVELQEEYFECLGEYLNIEELGGFFVLPESDNETIDLWDKAQKNCNHLRPDNSRKFSPATPEIMVSSLQTWIASILTNERFHIVNHAYVQAYRENSQLSGIPVKEDKSTIPEYFFEATYDCAKDPVIREYENQYGELLEEELYPSTLNIRMYFDGEQKELVKEWTTSGTMHLWSGLTNRMFKNPDAVMRQDIPITDLLEEFEKKPLFCRIDPDETQLDKGEETEIRLSDFRDARMASSREFNRIIVHASEGEILNGEKSESGDQYRVFRLDELPVVVKYKAPGHGNANGARITVFNSCDIVPVEKLSLRSTSPGEQIASCDLLLNNYAWTGTINLEITQTFTCDVEKQVSDLSSLRTRASDHKRTVANITIGLSDFDLPSQGTSAGAKLQYISGQLTGNLNEDHTTEGTAQKTDCVLEGKHRWISPGNWAIRHETMAGHAYCDIGEGGITLLIVKEMLGDKQEMENMQQEMAKLQAKMQEAAALAESAAIETYKAEMLKLVQGDKNSSVIPVRVSLTISPTGSQKYPVNNFFKRQVFNVCTGDFEENDTRSETLEMQLLTPVSAEMKGNYSSDDKGNDRIEASINDDKPFQTTFGSGICPDGIIIITGSITLERKKN
jgi:hypothetical protein